MSSRKEEERIRIMESGSPLSKNSLNQRNIGWQSEGEDRLFGKLSKKERRSLRRKQGKSNP